MIKAKLFVLGTEREVLWTDLEYHRYLNDKTGRCGEIPMGGLVTLAFASGYDDDRLLRWMTHSQEGEICTLTACKIVFYKDDFDGVVLFEYKYNDATIVYWKETFSSIGEEPMTVTMTISAAIQEVKWQTLIKPWQESWIPPSEQMPYQAVESTSDPRILEAFWMDEHMENRIDTSVFTKKATLVVKTANIASGESVQLKIRRKDNQSLGGKKYIMYQGVVNDEGQAEMKSLELDENWIKTN